MITSNPEAYRGHRPSYSAAPGSRASFSAAPGGHRSSFSIAPAGSPTSYSAPPPVFMTEPIPNGLGDRYSIITHLYLQHISIIILQKEGQTVVVVFYLQFRLIGSQ